MRVRVSTGGGRRALLIEHEDEDEIEDDRSTEAFGARPPRLPIP